MSTPLSMVHLQTFCPSVFVYEPNAVLLDQISRCLHGVQSVRGFADPNAFLRDVRSAPSVRILIVSWDGSEAALDVVKGARMSRPEVPAIIVTSAADPREFNTFADLGAAAVVQKPIRAADLRSTVERFLSADDGEAIEPKEVQLDATHTFVRASRRMAKIESQASLVARSDIPVLILGESGTGKEIIAMYTHKVSRRCNRMFLKLNCAAMPAELLESELFGYEQGAFTGALKTKPGKFELCDGGTIFLDEIGEMPAILQAKLLQVLQDGTFSRLGGRAPMRTDVRIIAATNVNLKEAMAKKTFREDLYYRLNGLSLTLPPLRERLEEIPVLASFFMRKSAQKYGVPALPFSSFLLNAFAQYPWPGNLRELENLVNRYLILGSESAILSELQPPIPTYSNTSDWLPTRENSRDLKRLVHGLKGEAESAMIASVLKETKWNRKAAANDLHISYKALLYKIKQYELSPPSSGMPL